MLAQTRPSTSHSDRQSARSICDLDHAHVKATLGIRIIETLSQNGLTQSAAAQLLGVDQPKVSRLMRGQLEDFSTPRLLRFLALLGQDIEIIVSTPTLPANTGIGQLRVVANNGPQS